MMQRRKTELAGVRIPHTRGAVSRAGASPVAFGCCDPFAIRTERGAVDLMIVAQQKQLVSGASVPHSSGTIAGRGHNPPGVRAEFRGIERVVIVAQGRGDRFKGVAVPNLCYGGARGDQELLLIGTELKSPCLPSLLQWRVQQRSSVHVPEPDIAVD